MVTDKWLKKDPELANKIDKSVFPWLQWWPHDHQTFAIAVALWEALKPEFIESNKKIVKNAKFLAWELINYWFDLISGWTDNHLILINVWKWRWIFMQDALDTAWITLNKNTIPKEPFSPFYPSGIRLGTPSLTTRGMKEDEMKLIANIISEIIKLVAVHEMSNDKIERIQKIKDFKIWLKENKRIKEIQKDVKELATKFPIYPGYNLE